MPDSIVFVLWSVFLQLQSQATQAVVMADDDIYIPGPLKGFLVLVFGSIGTVVGTLFWQLLSSLKERAVRAEKLYDELLPIVQDNTSTVEKMNVSVSALMETVRDEMRRTPRRAT